MVKLAIFKVFKAAGTYTCVQHLLQKDMTGYSFKPTAREQVMTEVLQESINDVISKYTVLHGRQHACFHILGGNDVKVCPVCIMVYAAQSLPAIELFFFIEIRRGEPPSALQRNLNHLVKTTIKLWQLMMSCLQQPGCCFGYDKDVYLLPVLLPDDQCLRTIDLFNRIHVEGPLNLNQFLTTGGLNELVRLLQDTSHFFKDNDENGVLGPSCSLYRQIAHCFMAPNVEFPGIHVGSDGTGFQLIVTAGLNKRIAKFVIQQEPRRTYCSPFSGQSLDLDSALCKGKKLKTFLQEQIAKSADGFGFDEDRDVVEYLLRESRIDESVLTEEKEDGNEDYLAGICKVLLRHQELNERIVAYIADKYNEMIYLSVPTALVDDRRKKRVFQVMALLVKMKRGQSTKMRDSPCQISVQNTDLFAIIQLINSPEIHIKSEKKHRLSDFVIQAVLYAHALSMLHQGSQAWTRTDIRLPQPVNEETDTTSMGLSELASKGICSHVTQEDEVSQESTASGHHGTPVTCSIEKGSSRQPLEHDVSQTYVDLGPSTEPRQVTAATILDDASTQQPTLDEDDFHRSTASDPHSQPLCSVEQTESKTSTAGSVAESGRRWTRNRDFDSGPDQARKVFSFYLSLSSSDHDEAALPTALAPQNDVGKAPLPATLPGDPQEKFVLSEDSTTGSVPCSDSFKSSWLQKDINSHASQAMNQESQGLRRTVTDIRSQQPIDEKSDTLPMGLSQQAASLAAEAASTDSCIHMTQEDEVSQESIASGHHTQPLCSVEQTESKTSTAGSMAESDRRSTQNRDFDSGPDEATEVFSSYQSFSSSDHDEAALSTALASQNDMDKAPSLVASKLAALPGHPREKFIVSEEATTGSVPCSDSFKSSWLQKDISGTVDSSNEQEEVPAWREIVQFKYQELKQVTEGFDLRPAKEGGHKIGAGSFGDVFYARIKAADGEVKDVAIKKIKQPKSSKQSKVLLNRRQFPTEVMALTRCHHPNIVRLIGQCAEGPELCLVFEYMPGGTLTLLLAKDNPNSPLWHVRLRVVCEIARAVNYLHTLCSPGLVHRDLKSANVLLSAECIGKLADFGLCIPVDDEEDPFASFTVTAAVGTRSYMAPEAFKGRVSPRVDIYSFGMVIYEVVTGLPPFSVVKKKDLVTFMRELERQGSDLAVMIDPRAKWGLDVAADLLKLARWCTDYDSHKRPPMTVVVSILEMLMRDHPPPWEQPF